MATSSGSLRLPLAISACSGAIGTNQTGTGPKPCALASNGDPLPGCSCHAVVPATFASTPNAAGTSNMLKRSKSAGIPAGPR